MTERRRFIVKASGAMVAVAAATIVDAPNVIAQPKVQWRMSTAWPPVLDNLQGAARLLAKVVEEMSGGGSGSRSSRAARSCRGSAASSAGLGGKVHRLV